MLYYSIDNHVSVSVHDCKMKIMIIYILNPTGHQIMLYYIKESIAHLEDIEFRSNILVYFIFLLSLLNLYQRQYALFMKRWR